MEQPPQAGEKYAVIMVRRDKDRFGHNELFGRELSVAFSQRRLPVRVVDYIGEPSRVLASLRDPDCRFFVSFNGFGTELRATSGTFKLLSAFSLFQKPVFDLMHDCPAHESMGHQLASVFPERHLLITDYGYAGLATAMGFPNVNFVASIAFPATVGTDIPRASERSIDVLLPIGLSPPAQAAMRHRPERGIKNQIYHSVFSYATERAIADWRLDPIAELFKSCREAGLMFDPKDPDGRFLLTTVVDFVKFSRRRRLLQAISHLPVTVMADRELPEPMPASRLQFIAPRSATEMLHLMRDAKCVLCPTPHMTGFHERVLGAMSAGAAVIASPNKILEANFVQARHLTLFRQEAEAADLIERLLAHPDWLNAMAHEGREEVMGRFAPLRLVDTILMLAGLAGA